MIRQSDCLLQRLFGCSHISLREAFRRIRCSKLAPWWRVLRTRVLPVMCRHNGELCTLLAGCPGRRVSRGPVKKGVNRVLMEVCNVTVEVWFGGNVLCPLFTPSLLSTLLSTVEQIVHFLSGGPLLVMGSTSHGGRSWSQPLATSSDCLHSCSGCSRQVQSTLASLPCRE